MSLIPKRETNKAEIEIKAFRNHMIEEELSTNTIDTYIHALKEYFKLFDGVLTKENLLEYKQYLIERRSPKTVNHRLGAIRRYAEFKGVDISVKRVKEMKRTSVDNVITIEEFNRLIECLRADGREDFATYLTIIGKTGARVSEFLQFTKADLDAGYKILYTKGKVRKIMFPTSLREEVRDFFKDYKPDEVLCKNRFGNPMTSRGVDQMLKDKAKKYGIPAKVAHVHGLRHMFAIEFLKRNNNIALLADLLGHSSVNTTMIYLRMSEEQQQDALDKAVDW